MRIKVPKFMRKLACKYVAKAIEEETGIRMDIEIDNMVVDTTNRDYRLHMSETISVDKRDLKRFIKENMKKEP